MKGKCDSVNVLASGVRRPLRVCAIGAGASWGRLAETLDEHGERVRSFLGVGDCALSSDGCTVRFRVFMVDSGRLARCPAESLETVLVPGEDNLIRKIAIQTSCTCPGQTSEDG